MDSVLLPKDENVYGQSDDQIFNQLEKIKKESLQPLNEPLAQSMTASVPDYRAIQHSLLGARKAIDDALLLLGLKESAIPIDAPPRMTSPATPMPQLQSTAVLEGVFDGQGMLGADGRHYTMSPNYASKSKLVEGDRLKLTIGENGMLLYKQTLPVQRKRLMGTLQYDAAAKAYSVAGESNQWRVLTASVTFYKGAQGDSVAIIIPLEGLSTWAAVEHIIKQS